MLQVQNTSPPKPPPPTRNATATPPEPDDKKKESLINAYNTATKRIAGGKSDGNMQEEVEFGKAYQALVKAGLVGQIKKKYRGR